MILKSVTLFVFVFLITSCDMHQGNTNTAYAGFGKIDNTPTIKLPKKWYEGKAEISSYSLQQNRYDDRHPGEVVMIFVTEDFLTDKQVKNDNYTEPHSAPVLKNNQIRKFTTGIYDYSMFTSVFTDVSNSPNTLKVTTSSQDWCGQSFTQLNKKGSRINVKQFSYFENEGDSVHEIKNALIIDEVFNLIRIDDNQLPTGDILCIPSTAYSRLKHKTLKPYKANTLLIDYAGELTSNPAKVYVVKIPELNLKYEFVYHDNDLRDIIQWNEQYPSAFDGEVRRTTATRKANIWTDYWNKNALSDSLLRQELKLMY